MIFEMKGNRLSKTEQGVVYDMGAVTKSFKY